MRRKKGEDINGWLIVDKPRDIGSTQVVNLTRRLFNAKKNGHAGTLDPFATGILPIAFGEATKLLPYVTDGRKEYEFVVQWGKATDTGDSEGKIVSESDKIPDREEILAVIPQFVGRSIRCRRLIRPLKSTAGGLMLWRAAAKKSAFPSGRWKFMPWSCWRNCRKDRPDSGWNVRKELMCAVWVAIWLKNWEPAAFCRSCGGQNAVNLALSQKFYWKI